MRNIQKDRFDRAIIQASLDMSRTMGLDVVAEGQEKKPLEIGCCLGQDYYYARPLLQARFMGFCSKSGFFAKSA